MVLLIGSLYLFANLLHWNVGLWDIIWPSALLIFGIYGVNPNLSFLSVGCIIFGGFFLVNNFIPVKVQLDNGVIIAVVILLIGGGLMMDALRKPKRATAEFSYDKDVHDHTPKHNFYIKEDTFCFDGAFGDCKQQVDMPLLQRGMINTSFGDLTIWVPSRFQVQCASSAAFASVEIDGKPDSLPAGTIQLIANASFGQITIEYI